MDNSKYNSVPNEIGETNNINLNNVIWEKCINLWDHLLELVKKKKKKNSDQDLSYQLEFKYFGRWNSQRKIEHSELWRV
jgi:hypothetical protein